jgi:hypothetical protein
MSILKLYNPDFPDQLHKLMFLTHNEAALTKAFLYFKPAKNEESNGCRQKTGSAGGFR